MSLILAIVLEATALAGQRAYEVGVLDAGLLKLLPKISPPTALDYCQYRADVVEDRVRTGLPVMESPRAMIRTVD